MFSSYLFLAATASTSATCKTIIYFAATIYYLHSLRTTFPKVRTARYHIISIFIVITFALASGFNNFWVGDNNSSWVGGNNNSRVGGNNCLWVGGHNNAWVGGNDSLCVWGHNNSWVGGNNSFWVGGHNNSWVGGNNSFWVGGRCYFVHFPESVKNKTVRRKSVRDGAEQLSKSTLNCRPYPGIFVNLNLFSSRKLNSKQNKKLKVGTSHTQERQQLIYSQ